MPITYDPYAPRVPGAYNPNDRYGHIRALLKRIDDGVKNETLDIEHTAEMLEPVAEGRPFVPVEGPPMRPLIETILVPDLPFSELPVLLNRSFAEEGLGLGYSHNRDYLAWDYGVTATRGKEYRIETWKPGAKILRSHVEECIRYTNGKKLLFWKDRSDRNIETLGSFDSNIGPFIAWIMRKKPQGNYIAIPSNDELLWRDGSGNPCALHYYRDGDVCSLRSIRVDGWLEEDLTFVFSCRIRAATL